MHETLLFDAVSVSLCEEQHVKPRLPLLHDHGPVFKGIMQNVGSLLMCEIPRRVTEQEHTLDLHLHLSVKTETL